MGAIYSDEMGTKREQKEKRPLSFSVGLVVSFQAYRQLQLGNAPPSSITAVDLGSFYHPPHRVGQ